MKNQKRRKTAMLVLGAASAEDLISRQSVRATFRLSSESLNAIRIIVKQLGVKPKSLFDHLLENGDSIEKVAPGLQQGVDLPPDRVQKTFVISKKSLSFLDQAARRYNAPRDMLVESLVHRLLPLISEEKKKHQARKQFLQDVQSHFESGNSLLHEVGKVLGENDPLYNKMLAAMSHYYTALKDMDVLVEKGKVLDEFSSEEMID